MTWHSIALGLATLAGLGLLYAVSVALFSPLRKVPGPVAARFTNLFYLNRVRHGNFHYENKNLHLKYGPVLRLGENLVSIDDPSALKTIYGIGSKFPKSDWYTAWRAPGPENFTLFSDQNMARHADTRKRFQNLYSMTSLVSYETFVDECADVFVRRLQEMADTGESINMGHWFQCYAFDVIACITYGSRFGFLDRGDDIRGMMNDLHAVLRYSTLVGIVSWLHSWIFYPASKLQLFGAKGRVTTMDFVKRRMAIREGERQLRKPRDKAKAQEEGVTRDFLDRLLDQHEDNPEKTTMYHVFLVGLANINAGSDTTATSLSGILYYLLRTPRVLAKLREEIESFTAQGQLSAHPTFKETQRMPYFDAVVKEALRLHSAVGLPLWRVVPEGGVDIAGRYLPAGTNVGINAWVAHFNEGVWGSDAKQFRPERWLEAQAAAQAGDRYRLQRMESYYMPFGLGSRSCVGKHISILEISKLIPRLLREFDFELKQPNQDWQCEDFWFVIPKGLSVRVKRAAVAS